MTGTPIVCLDGSLLLFQVIWKGRTTQCHPPQQSDWDSRIFNDHAVKKVQTGLSFGRLLERISRALENRRKDLNLPPGYPAILVVDNAPSHSSESFQPLPSPAKQCAHLLATSSAGLYLFTTLKNRSHTQNPGDQHINLSLRRLCRRRSKMRIVQHFLDLREGF